MEKNTSPRRYSFEFTISGLFSLFMFALLVIIWMFILGVLVGRGYKPERFIPKISALLPDEANKTQTIDATSKLPQDESSTGNEELQTLKPEDLTFFDSLKKKNETPTLPPAQPKTELQKNEAQPSGEPAAKPRAIAQTDKTAKTSTPQTATPPKQSTKNPEKTQTKSLSYRYIFQVAAFKEEQRAQSFRSDLKAKGIACSVLREDVAGIPWFRVYSSYDGTAEGAEKFMVELKNNGVKKPLLRGKKPL